MNSIYQPQIVSIKGLNFEPYIGIQAIELAADKVAAQIESDYKNCENYPVLLVTLSGAMAFAAEISKRLNILVEWAFVKCSSYDGSLSSSGNIKFELEPTINLTNRDVIVIEDIVDTGNTWAAMSCRFASLNLNSLSIATMCFKRDAMLHKNLKINYVGLEVENSFLIGFGLDYKGVGRNLNGIYKLKE